MVALWKHDLGRRFWASASETTLLEDTRGYRGSFVDTEAESMSVNLR